MKTEKKAIEVISMKACIENATLKNWADAKLLVMMSIGFNPTEMLAITYGHLPLLTKLVDAKLLNPVLIYALTKTGNEEEMKTQKQAFLNFLKSTR